MRHSSIQRPELPPTTTATLESQRLLSTSGQHLFSRSQPQLNQLNLPGGRSGSCYSGKLDGRPRTTGLTDRRRVQNTSICRAISSGELRCRTAPQVSSSISLPVHQSLSSSHRKEHTNFRGVGRPADRLQSEKLPHTGSVCGDEFATDEGKIHQNEDFEIIDQNPMFFGLDPLDHHKIPELQALKLEYDFKVEEEKLFCSKTAEAHTEMKLFEQRIKTMQEAVIEVTNISASLQRSVQKVSAVNMMLIGTLDALELQPTSDEGTHHSSIAISLVRVVVTNHLLLHRIPLYTSYSLRCTVQSLNIQ